MYTDFDSGCEVRNNFDTSLRMLLSSNFRKRNTQLDTPFSTLLLYSAVVETLFYLPNRFSQTVMLNTHNISFATTENALLSLMSVMFNIQSKPDVQEFKLRQFASCYRLFFTTTLPYETISLCARMKLFEEANKIMPGQWYSNGFAVGSFV